MHKIGTNGQPISKEPQGWSSGCVKLEKNSVIKLGRVRLRVRDIDYVTRNEDEGKSKDTGRGKDAGEAHTDQNLSPF